MQILEHSAGRLVLETRHRLFRVLGLLLLAVPVMAIVLLAQSASQWYERPELRSREMPIAMLIVFAGLFVVGLLTLLYGPYRIMHIFDRNRKAYVKESTSVRRTRRVELPLETFRSVEVEEEDNGGYRVILVDDDGKRLRLGEQPTEERAQVDAVVDLVESFLTRA